MQQHQQQWCTGCFSLVSSSIIYEKHSLVCPHKNNIKYSTSINPNAVNKLPELNRYPNNKELYQMIVALTDNLNKANKTINALKRKINLKSKNVDVLEFLNENIFPSITVDQFLDLSISSLCIITDDTSSENSSDSDGDTNATRLSMDTFYDIGFYSFVLQCLDSSYSNHINIPSYIEEESEEEDEKQEDIEDILKNMNTLSIENDDEIIENDDEIIEDDDEIIEDDDEIIEDELDQKLEQEQEQEQEKEKSSNTKSCQHNPPMLCFKQKKDIVYIFENNSWSQNNIFELTVNNVFNRFACLVNSKIMKLFADFRNRHAHELYVPAFQSVLSKRLNCICSIDMDNNLILTKIIKPWYNSHKLDLYDFMNRTI